MTNNILKDPSSYEALYLKSTYIEFHECYGRIDFKLLLKKLVSLSSSCPTLHYHPYYGIISPTNWHIVFFP